MEPIDHFLILVLQELLEFRIQNETSSVQVCVKHSPALHNQTSQQIPVIVTKLD
jgi:hypothetical protein